MVFNVVKKVGHKGRAFKIIFFLISLFQHIHGQKGLLTKPATNNALTYNKIIVTSYNTVCLSTLVTAFFFIVF